MNAQQTVRRALLAAEDALHMGSENVGHEWDSGWWQPWMEVRAALAAHRGTPVVHVGDGPCGFIVEVRTGPKEVVTAVAWGFSTDDDEYEVEALKVVVERVCQGRGVLARITNLMDPDLRSKMRKTRASRAVFSE